MKESLSCPPGYKFGHGEWGMARVASFGAGEDVCEVWRVGEPAVVYFRLKEGKWMEVESKVIPNHLSGALEGLRCVALDGWPYEEDIATKTTVDKGYIPTVVKILEAAVKRGKCSPVAATHFEETGVLTYEAEKAVEEELATALDLNLKDAEKGKESAPVTGWTDKGLPTPINTMVRHGAAGEKAAEALKAKDAEEEEKSKEPEDGAKGNKKLDDAISIAEKIRDKLGQG